MSHIDAAGQSASKAAGEIPSGRNGALGSTSLIGQRDQPLDAVQSIGNHQMIVVYIALHIVLRFELYGRR
jgi:hypothetical protein